jgi:hypothetical protein
MADVRGRWSLDEVLVEHSNTTISKLQLLLLLTLSTHERLLGVVQDRAVFMVNNNFKTSSLSRYFSAANAICEDTDVFNKDYIFLMAIL